MVVLITGVSSGFGEAMAKAFSAEGNRVYGTHRREVTDRIPAVTYIRADSCVDEDCRCAVEKVLSIEGRIDVFINNAGMGIGGPLEFNSLEEARAQMDVNWMGMVRFLHWVVPAMRRQKSGKIICISSIGGLMGLPFQGLYSASKFAIEGYCEALGLELRSSGVSVTRIEPGDFATGFTASRRSVPPADAAEAYPSYGRSLKSIEHDENTGLKPDALARKVLSISKKRRPGSHYIVATPVQRLSVTAKRMLPSRWFESILALYYKL